MPDRILRFGLFTSEGWLALKNNDDRVCWIVLFGNADVFGNQPAGPHRLIHYWRHAGIDTPEKAAKVLSELADVDLVRLYTDPKDGKRYIHIPKYRQRLRYVGHFNPLSEWNTPEEKQRVANISPEHRRRPPEVSCEPPTDVDVDVDVEVELETAWSLRNAKRAGKATPTLPAKPAGNQAPRTPATKTRATRLPATWSLPDDWLEWATIYRTDWTPERIQREALVFRDHWLAKSGPNATKLDWMATWRNWIRRAT